MPSDPANHADDAGQPDPAHQSSTLSGTNPKAADNKASSVTIEENQHQPVTMMYQTQQQGQPGAFDLAPMNNTLPSINHRSQHPSQYIHGHTQPYNPAASPPMAHQMAPMPPYGGPPMQMPSHPYYVQQQQMPQYYPGGHLAQPQNSSSVQGRGNMVYYPNQVMMNPAQPSFYCAQENQFASHPPPMPANMMTGAYMTGISKSDSRNSRIVVGNVNGGQYGQGTRTQITEWSTRV